jgi:hypothetical protein
LSQAVRCDGVQYGIVLAGRVGQSEGAFRMTRGGTFQQLREILADVTALPQEYRHHGDGPAARITKRACGGIEVRRHQLQKGQDDRNTGCCAHDAVAKALERLCPTRIAGPMGKEMRPACIGRL